MNLFRGRLDANRRFERAYATYLVNQAQVLSWPGLAEWWTDRVLVPARGLDAAIARHDRIAVVGGPGMGKTTALLKLATKQANRLLSGAPARVPIFISAQAADSDGLPGLSELPRVLSLPEPLAAQLPRHYFSDVLSSGRALVLIDDLDVPPKDQIQSVLEAFARAKVVAASSFPLPGMHEFRPAGFGDPDIEAFARRAASTGEGVSNEGFAAAVRAGRLSRSLTASPLTLALLWQVYRAGKALPSSRTDLFDAYVDTIFGEERQAPRTLEQVALAIQRSHRASSDLVSGGRGFLRMGRNGSPEFIHELCRAYFAARALRRLPEPEVLSELIQLPPQDETILFYAGLGDASSLIEMLIARGRAILAGRVLAHAPTVRADLRDPLIRELTRLASGGDVDAAAALAEAGSDDAVDAIAAGLKDKDPAARRRAAQLLGDLRLDRGVEYLLPQLRDADEGVRAQVVEALGRARTDRVIEPLLVALRGDPRTGRSNTRLRAAAARALGEIGSDRAVPALIVDLQLGEPEVKAAAAEALMRIDSPLMVEPLRSLLGSGDEGARRCAAQILASLDGDIGERV